MVEERKPLRKGFEFAGITINELEYIMNSGDYRSESEAVSYAIHRLYDSYKGGEFSKRGRKEEVK